jgi:hypothetical protein
MVAVHSDVPDVRHQLSDRLTTSSMHRFLRVTACRLREGT